MSRACRVQKTCGHAALPVPVHPRPASPRRSLRPPSHEYNMHYAKSVTLMLGLENTLNSLNANEPRLYSVDTELTRLAVPSP